MPRNDRVGPRWLPSAVWLYTTSRMTSMPAACSACTMVLNSITAIRGFARRRVAQIRRKETERVVAPVVRQTALDEVPVVGMMVHRQQFDGRDAQALQMIDDGVEPQRRIGAAQLVGTSGCSARESFDVHLVNDRLVPRRTRRSIARPSRTPDRSPPPAARMRRCRDRHGRGPPPDRRWCSRTSRRPTGPAARSPWRTDRSQASRS